MTTLVSGDSGAVSNVLMNMLVGTASCAGSTSYGLWLNSVQPPVFSRKLTISSLLASEILGGSNCVCLISLSARMTISLMDLFSPLLISITSPLTGATNLTTGFFLS